MFEDLKQTNKQAKKKKTHYFLNHSIFIALSYFYTDVLELLWSGKRGTPNCLDPKFFTSVWTKLISSYKTNWEQSVDKQET